MTQNQISFYKARNEKEHYERADLTNRMAHYENVTANRNREFETNRHNVEDERKGWAAHAETVRDNKARAAIQYAYNNGYLNELNRANVERETENTQRRIQEMNLKDREISNNMLLGRQNVKLKGDSIQVEKGKLTQQIKHDAQTYSLGLAQNRTNQQAQQSQAKLNEYNTSYRKYFRDLRRDWYGYQHAGATAVFKSIASAATRAGF